MSGLLDFIAFASLVILITGLIKPSIFKRFFKTTPTRKTIALFSLGIFFVSSIGSSLISPRVEEGRSNSTFGNYATQHGVPSTTKTIAVETVATQINAAVINSDNKTASQTAKVKTPQPTKPAITPTTQTNSQYAYYSVSSVVDGDTIKVSINGTVVTLRLIGMDTPETVDPRKPVQCFGKAASDKAKELLTNKKVRIEKDVTQGELDKYGRTLAYIYREDGLFYNKHMIEQGYAHEYTYNSNPYKYQTEFKAAQKLAQENLRGLWSPDTCNGNTTSSAATSSPPAQAITTNTSTAKYYTSSFRSSKNYYPASCPGWQDLSKSYLKAFDSLEALLAAYPSKTLSPQCQ